MKPTLTLIVLLLMIGGKLFGQETKEFEISEEVICIQINSSLAYIKKEWGIGKKIKYDPEIKSGNGYEMMQPEYLSLKLGIEKDEVFIGTNDVRDSLRSVIETKASSEISYTVDCHRKYKSHNTTFSKLDNDTLLAFITLKGPGRKGPSGIIAVFKFSNSGEIINCYKTTWIE